MMRIVDVMILLLMIVVVIRKNILLPVILVKKLLSWHMKLIKMLQSLNVMLRISKASKKNKVKTLIKSWLLSRKTKKILILLKIN